MSWSRPCVSVFNLRMRVCPSINLSVQLEKFPFNITHSRSEIEWSGMLTCLATGSPLMLSRMLFDIFHTVFHLCSYLSHIYIYIICIIIRDNVAYEGFRGLDYL